MTRTPRFRSRAGIDYIGTSKSLLNDVVVGTGVVTVNYGGGTCSDSVGQPVVDSPFSCHTLKGRPALVNGRIRHTDDPRFSQLFEGMPVRDGTSLDTSSPHMPSGWMLDLVAGTNPSRPVVTPPTLLQDLIELPAMIRHAGTFLTNPKSATIPKGLADLFLSIKFGWAPLVKDIEDLLDLQKHVIKRSKELNRLASSRSGMRRRLSMGETKDHQEHETQLFSWGSKYGTYRCLNTVEKKTWATIRWFPTDPLPPYHPDDPRLNALATRIVLGLTPEGLAKGAWDVIPWTWLLGWFTNVGKYALAHSMTVPARHSGGCLMRSSTWDQSYSGFSPGPNADVTGLTISDGHMSSTLKVRDVSSAVSVGANVPFFDTSRLSIVAALFAQRFKL